MILATLALLAVTASAQEGYWDKERATSREIIVPAGNRIAIKTENFPAGTTEIVYRITVLDENQQMANSLVSLLKAIPDPSGVSQGSAGAVFLLSKISGDDKCRYAVFTDKERADSYKISGKPEGACLYQNNPISKEAKLFSGNSACLKGDNLWFGFESDNWVMKQKIVLEVVPWVDAKARSGWDKETKKEVMDLCATSPLATLMGSADNLCLCVLDKFIARYSYIEYLNLTVAEKNKAYGDFGNVCLDHKTADKTLLASIRVAAHQHYKLQRFDKTIDLINAGLIYTGNANAKDYDAIGQAYLFSKQFTKAIQSFQDGEKLDDSNLSLKLGLANAYMLSGEFSKAKELHKKYRSENISAVESWSSRAKANIEQFRKAGFESKDFNRILKLLE